MSPSSAKGNIDAPLTIGGGSQPHSKHRKGSSKRPLVAVKLRMDDQVTAQAITYAAVQVCCFLHQFPRLTQVTFIKLHFTLTNATHWISDYNGFNYKEFYEFIVDFFEADQTPEGKAASAELYDWWNKYVYNLKYLVPVLALIPPQTSIS